MATDKKRIQAYVTEETIPKFRIVTALKGYKSMSEYAGSLIEKSIADYESQHGPIPLDQSGEGGGVKADVCILHFISAYAIMQPGRNESNTAYVHSKTPGMAVRGFLCGLVVMMITV